MAFEDLQSELGLLMTRMQNEPHDRHELHLLIRQKLNEIRAFGMPLPEDLVQVREAARGRIRRGPSWQVQLARSPGRVAVELFCPTAGAETRTQ
jgi:hypothetical protein